MDVDVDVELPHSRKLVKNIKAHSLIVKKKRLTFEVKSIHRKTNCVLSSCGQHAVVIQE